MFISIKIEFFINDTYRKLKFQMYLIELTEIHD